MFFSGTVQDALLFQKTIAVVNDVIHECCATLSRDGISIQSMDTSHVCLVHVMWPSSAFESFHIDGCMTIGIHLGNLLKILKCCNKNDNVTLSIENEENDTLTLSFDDDARTASFSMKLINRDDEDITVPDMEYDASITMNATEFQSVCKDLSVFSDTTTLSVNKEGISFSVTGEIGTALLTYEHVDIRGDLQESLSQAFALRYLNSFAKGSTIADTVEMKMSSDMPLVLTFENTISYISFYLAPKIDDDLDGE